MRGWLVVLVVGCGSGDPGTPGAAPRPTTPTGRITSYRCDASGDYRQREILATVKARAAAWQACAHATVTATDGTTRVTSGSFEFSWQLASGSIRNERHTTAGSQDCSAAIIDQLRKTPPFAGAANGTLDCVIAFDDSLR